MEGRGKSAVCFFFCSEVDVGEVMCCNLLKVLMGVYFVAFSGGKPCRCSSVLAAPASTPRDGGLRVLGAYVHVFRVVVHRSVVHGLQKESTSQIEHLSREQWLASSPHCLADLLYMLVLMFAVCSSLLVIFFFVFIDSEIGGHGRIDSSSLHFLGFVDAKIGGHDRIRLNRLLGP